MPRSTHIAFIMACALGLLFASHTPAKAHFGMVIPSTSTVTEKEEAGLVLDLAFAHPRQGMGMRMEKPQSFAVYHNGKTQSLMDTLKETTCLGNKAWQAKFRIQRPGVYQFAMEPAPYFEPAENCYIIHYTKTVVAAFGSEDGWEEALGLKTEIVPLTRPFANYAGNVFAGRVLLDGKPVPGAAVEVECLDRDGKLKPLNEYFTTQVVRADENGVFVYGVPWPGWWGFASLNEGGERPGPDGKIASVELGAVLWVNFAAPEMK